MVKWGVDGYSGKCRNCFREERLIRYHTKKKNLQKIGDVQGEGKVPNLKKAKISQEKIRKWSRDRFLICTLRCKNCNKIHEIRILSTYSYKCECKRTLICLDSINYLWAEPLYLSKLMKDDYLFSFDPWR
jgi:hypothetical protein